MSSEITTWPAWIKAHRAALAFGDRHAWAELDAAIIENDALTVVEDTAEGAPTRHLGAVPASIDTTDTPPAGVDISDHLGELIAHHTQLRDLQAVIDDKTTAPEHRAQATVAPRNLLEAMPVTVQEDDLLVQASDAGHPQTAAVLGDDVFARALAAAQPTVTWTANGPHVEQPRGVSVTVRKWLYTAFTRAGSIGLMSSEVRNLTTRLFPDGVGDTWSAVDFDALYEGSGHEGLRPLRRRNLDLPRAQQRHHARR